MKRLLKRTGGVWMVVLTLTPACSRNPTSQSAGTLAPPVALPRSPSPEHPATTKPFGVACVDDAECAGTSAVCFHHRTKSPDAGREQRGVRGPEEHEGYCSLRCSDDKDCPVPLTRGKCGARGMCKRP